MTAQPRITSLLAREAPRGLSTFPAKSGGFAEWSLESRSVQSKVRCWLSPTTARELRDAAVKRILIADDHEVVRSGLRAIIGARPDWIVSGEATDGEQAVALALET